jgi:hypothetical protein
MSQLSSEGGLEVQSDKVWIIDAICINCKKRFKSVRAVTMHLKMTSARHAVNFIDHGNYNKNTGLRKLKRVGK